MEKVMDVGNSSLLPWTEMKWFLKKPDKGERTGFQLCVCYLHSFPSCGQSGSNQWVLEADMMFECNGDKREVRDLNIVSF